MKGKLQYFRSIDNQRVFIDNLYNKFKLNSLDEWLNIPRKEFLKSGGSIIATNFYSNDIKKLLVTVYPNYSWDFNKKKKENNSLNNITNQRLFLDKLYKQFKLTSFDDWIQITRNKISQNGGSTLIYYYSNDLYKLFTTLYPNYPWETLFRQFKAEKQKKLNINSVENKQQLFDNLFEKFELKTLQEWETISKYKFNQNGALKILRYYSNDINKVLTSIYPNYPWKKEFIKKEKKKFDIHFQRDFMDLLFQKLKLKSFDDWYKISRAKLIKNQGKRIVTFYLGNKKNLLTTIYPNFPWIFDKSPHATFEYFKRIENQIIFMENLFQKFHLKCLDDFRKIGREKIIKNGGKNLLMIHSFDIIKLLRTIYPNYCWKVDDNLILSNQREKMVLIAKRLKLNQLIDWLNVSRLSFIRKGGKNLLEHYSYDFKNLLTTIYSDYQFNFEENRLRFRPVQKYFQSFEFYTKKLKILQKKYEIKEKKDWYRLNIRTDEINVFKALKLIYPLEKWQKNLFILRAKKTNQRFLFLATRQLYPSQFLLENYRHPQIIVCASLEFDIFIPSLNIALEYQGECHYDDISMSGYSTSILNLMRDQRKEILALENSIHLILVPFWWDQSLPSLLSSILLSQSIVKT